MSLCLWAHLAAGWLYSGYIREEHEGYWVHI